MLSHLVHELSQENLVWSLWLVNQPNLKWINPVQTSTLFKDRCTHDMWQKQRHQHMHTRRPVKCWRSSSELSKLRHSLVEQMVSPAKQEQVWHSILKDSPWPGGNQRHTHRKTSGKHRNKISLHVYNVMIYMKWWCRETLRSQSESFVLVWVIMVSYCGPELPFTMKTQLQKVKHNKKSQNTITDRKTQLQNKTQPQIKNTTAKGKNTT